MRTFFALIVALPLLTACATGSERPPPVTVSEVDLSRYMGKWYEIAKLPNEFQDHCVRNTTAEYRLRDDGRVEVTNRCVTRDGAIDVASGIARRSGDDNARLEVSFFDILGWRPVWGDYWVIGLDRGYDWAVVGHPEREYGWILSRAPRLPIPHESV